MEKKTTPLNGQSNSKDELNALSVDNDFKILSAFKYPFKVDVTTAMIYLKGSMVLFELH